MPHRDAGEILVRIDAVVERERRRLKATAPEADIVMEELSCYPALDTGIANPATLLVARLAQDPQPAGTVAFGTEAGLYAEAGITTLVCGPGDMVRGHKADEWIGVGELKAASAMMDKLAEWVLRADEGCP